MALVGHILFIKNQQNTMEYLYCDDRCLGICVGLIGRNQLRPLPAPTSNTPKVPRGGDSPNVTIRTI